MQARRWICTAAVLGALGLGTLGWSRPAAAQCMADWHCLWQEWIVDCVGDWDCIDFDCIENCDDHQCGNGICDALWGESMESCADDCVTPTCVEPSNCIGQDWDPFCQGHWDCVVGECVPICELETCGDGYCDPVGGESFFSCMDDCWLGCEALTRPRAPSANRMGLAGRCRMCRGCGDRGSARIVRLTQWREPVEARRTACARCRFWHGIVSTAREAASAVRGQVS